VEKENEKERLCEKEKEVGIGSDVGGEGRQEKLGATSARRHMLMEIILIDVFALCDNVQSDLHTYLYMRTNTITEIHTHVRIHTARFISSSSSSSSSRSISSGGST